MSITDLAAAALQRPGEAKVERGMGRERGELADSIGGPEQLRRSSFCMILAHLTQSEVEKIYVSEYERIQES